MSRQANQYDKIFKENIEAVIPSLMQTILGITAVVSEELPDDVQHTKERRPDVLKKITDTEGDTYVLQIEFQVADEPKMIYRMAEYYIMLERKHEISVRQFVIFLGTDKPRMPTRLDSPSMQFRFSLITFSELDYGLFLRSSRPEEVVLSILASFRGNKPETALRQILRRVEETTDTDLALMRYFNQLRVLAQLRSLDLKLKEAMDSIAQYINEERDVLYLRGLDKGQEKAREQEQTRFVTNLLLHSDFSVQKVAEMAGVSVEFVMEVQSKLSNR